MSSHQHAAFDPRGAHRPGKVIAVHLNYPSRIAQRGRTPLEPSYFLKPSTAISYSGECVERPAGTELLAFEAEIALIIGAVARNVTPEEAWNFVASVTAANDLGVYDLRWIDRGSNLRAKGGDGFLPLGPGLIDARTVGPTDLRVRAWLDGALVQEDTSANLTFPFAQLIADLSQFITLEPGDVILTGTPAGASVAVPGQTIEVEVDAPLCTSGPTTGRLVTQVVEGVTEPGRYGGGAHCDNALRVDAWGDRTAAGLGPEFALTTELKRSINSVGVATLSAQLRKRGLDNVSIDGVRPLLPGQRMVGRARTLRFVPAREDLAKTYGGGYNAQKRAFDDLGRDDVLVVEARGETATGTVGDILALRAQVCGAAGFVSDGGVRDSAEVRKLGLPVFAAGSHPAVLGRRHVPWDVDLTISCGGATIQPGDVIVGDDDGVIVIPPRLVDDVVEGALLQEAEERFIADQVRRGARVDGLYPLTGDWREQFDRTRSDETPASPSSQARPF